MTTDEKAIVDAINREWDGQRACELRIIRNVLPVLSPTMPEYMTVLDEEIARLEEQP
jgi:hypothetical protein